jgi:hypothetical protein
MSLFAAAENGGAFLGFGLGMLALFLFAWIFIANAPIWIAFYRGHPNAVPIALITFFLSWTGIAWIICLAWSCSSIDRGNVIVNVGRRSRRRSRDDDYDDD